jgi:riboflavin kinase/FMN adenylyltransferase
MVSAVGSEAFEWLHPGEPLPQHLRRGVIAVGNFDGVHLGHRGVLDEALRHANALGAPALVLTFEPHPRTFFRPQAPVFRLTPPAEKARLVRRLGFAAMVEKRFDEPFSMMPASSFVYRLLGQEMRARHVVAGVDFHFGKDRFGTPQFLKERAAEMKIGVTLVEPVRDASGDVISSTRIRHALADGEMALANSLLGRPFRVSGPVIEGKQLGRTLGYPTANMALPQECTLRHGIYAVRVIRADGSSHDGVASYGRRPTFDNGAALLESFLFDFAGDLYGEELAVEFHAFLRGEEKFDNVEALVAQMDEDSRQARAALSGAAP